MKNKGLASPRKIRVLKSMNLLNENLLTVPQMKMNNNILATTMNEDDEVIIMKVKDRQSRISQLGKMELDKL